jgi:hypothetical protein
MESRLFNLFFSRMGNTDSTPQHGGDGSGGESATTATTSDPGNTASAFPVSGNVKKRNTGTATGAGAPPPDPVATPADPVASAPPADPAVTTAEPEGNEGTIATGENDEGEAEGNNGGSTNDAKKKEECEELMKPSPDIQKIEEAPGFFSWLGNWFSYDYWQETEEEKKKQECEEILGKDATNETNESNEDEEESDENNTGEVHSETITKVGANAPPPKPELLGTQSGGRRHTHKNRTCRRKTHKNRE